MKLRDLDKVDYKDTRTNGKRSDDPAARASIATKARGRKPGAATKGRKASNAVAADQRRTETGRIVKASAILPKRGPGRPPTSLSRRGPGRPPKNGARARASDASSVAHKTPARRSLKREYKPASPVIKIDKPPPAVQKNQRNGEHHVNLMHKFFRAHEDKVAHIPKNRRRKTLGKMWRESPLNPKNARAEKGPGGESESVDLALQGEDDDENSIKDDTNEQLDEETRTAPVELAERDASDGQHVSSEGELYSLE
ncbi:hypothetical protein MPH_07840 [Macrophomina phaseolina MS6]|uniref:Uncharacterized protein n=2 Tax=Macrophomina phaseolina TaxID=35725 RepID=K2SDJ8_MACPH|nr:hypothetical protein MPH_07840 [Macrophomina phaseolina MS6]KAH7062070.1 hypothetical protein B0J12DRAFT_694658 [Macrophomina phaseolina]